MSKNNGVFTPAQWQSATKQAMELGKRAAAAADRTEAQRQVADSQADTGQGQNGAGSVSKK